jgi:hypothetical protein
VLEEGRKGSLQQAHMASEIPAGVLQSQTHKIKKVLEFAGRKFSADEAGHPDDSLQEQGQANVPDIHEKGKQQFPGVVVAGLFNEDCCYFIPVDD